MSEWHNQQRKQCPGCGALHVVGFACVACYPRLPLEIRRGLVAQPGKSRYAAEKRQRMEAAALAWFVENPVSAR